MIKQLPISLHGGKKDDVRTQFAALCYRVKADKLQVLLITSRTTKRWIVPKGWPMHGKTPAETAAHEAWEEAGVQGRPSPTCLGVFSYAKGLEDADDDLPCLAMLYPIRVKALARQYPERKERRRRWVSRKKAAKLLSEPELVRLVREFDPDLLKPAQ